MHIDDHTALLFLLADPAEAWHVLSRWAVVGMGGWRVLFVLLTGQADMAWSLSSCVV